MASSRLAIGVFATSDWRSLQQRVALPVFQRMLLFGKTRLTDCLDRERVSFSASQLRNSHVKKLDNTSHTYEIDFADQNLAHPTFRVMRQSCSAYSLSLKYLSSLKPYAVRFITFILLFIPSTLAVEI